jgi:hypothetical protein
VSPSTSLARAVTSPARLVAAALRSVLESPVTESDARDLFASWRVGLWLCGLVVFLALAALGVGASYFVGVQPLPALVARNGVGHVLVSTTLIATAAFLTLAVPIRAAGLLEGPRWRGYFDQLVASGITPWRYFAGRALVTQAFILLMLAGTFPVVTVFALLDPPPLWPVVEGYLLVAIYAEVLLALALGLGVLIQEIFATTLTILAAIALGAVAFAPIPTALAALSPVRGIISPHALAVPDVDLTFTEAIYGPPCPFGFEVPLLPYAALLSAIVIGLALISCVFGPLHAFAPGFNNFGTVVLPGDRKRVAIRRIRPVLARRAELAFFFENRGPTLDALAPWARAIQIGGTLAFLGTVLIGGLFYPTELRWSFGTPLDEEVLILVPLVFGPLALLAPFLFASSKTDARLSFAVGKLRFPVVLADVFVYCGVMLWLLVLLFFSLGRILLLLRLTQHLKTPLAFLAAGVEWGAILAVVGLTLVLLQKIFGLRTWGRIPGVIAAVVLVAAAPLVLLRVDPHHPRSDENETLARKGKLNPEVAYRDEDENARTLTALHFAFPLRMRLALEAVDYQDIRLPRAGPWRWLAFYGFWAIYPGLDLLLLLGVARLITLRREESSADLLALALECKKP